MGHKYVKDNEIFTTSQNGVVPKPTAQEVSDNKVLRADGSWVEQSGGGGGGGGGNAGLYTGNAAPSAGTGENGDLYFQIMANINYLKMTIYANRGNSNITQFSDIRLKSAAGTYYTFTGDIITASNPGNPGEDVDKLIDNNTSTKYCTGYRPSTASPLIITLQFTNGFNVFDFPIFEYWTANDSSERDPVSFDISVSEDGVNYTDVVQAIGASITTSRQVLGFAANLAKALLYYKIGGSWNKISV